jgi:hypothetical protein
VCDRTREEMRAARAVQTACIMRGLLISSTLLVVGCTEMVPVRPADVPQRGGGAHLDIAMTDGTRLDVAHAMTDGTHICGTLRRCEGPQCGGAQPGIDTCVVPEGVASLRQEKMTPAGYLGAATLGLGIGAALAYGLLYAITSPFRNMGPIYQH